MANFEEALAVVLEKEGGLSERKNDPGGITKCGISLRFLKSLPVDQLKNYSIFEVPNDETVRHLNKEQITKIYHDEFWVKADFHKINHQELCNYLFDASVNMGLAPAIKCVQRAIWSNVADNHALKDDGILGDVTLDYINTYSDLLMSALRSERAGHYRLIAAEHNSQQEFLAGWLNRAYKK